MSVVKDHYVHNVTARRKKRTKYEDNKVREMNIMNVILFSSY